MAEYLIYFNGEWVPEFTEDEILERIRHLRPLIADMKQRGVLIFTGGLEPDGPVFTAVPDGDSVIVTDGPYVETKEHIGGFAVVDVDDAGAARYWAEKIAVACGWPQEVQRFQVPRQLPVES